MEGLKDPADLLARNAHSRVDHLALELRIGRFLVEEVGYDPHLAGGGEFDRVADKIDQNLAKPRWIGGDGFRDGPGELEGGRRPPWRPPAPASAR